MLEFPYRDRIAAAALLLSSLLCSFAQAAPTAEQRRQVGLLRAEVRKAGSLYSQGQFKESAEIVRDVQGQLEQLEASAGDGSRELQELLEPLRASLNKAHALLELEGITLPPLKAVPASPAATSQISFTRQIAPLLVSKCGRCHITNTRGMFRMASFAELMRGTPDGPVILPKNPQGSRMVEVIETGDMPRGGGSVSPAELELLKSWIAAGASYDGQDPEASLAAMVPRSQQAEAPQVARSTGSESISFARDIAPVLVGQCVACHGDGQQVSARFNLTTFEGLLRGGESGSPIAPGKPAESLLVQKLKGTTEGERMPRGRDPLPDDVIARFETWISEGATFDGLDPKQHVAEVAALDKARRSTHEELSAARAERAESTWRLAAPNTPPSKAKTENFLLMGDMDPAVLQQYGEAAEDVVQQLRRLLRISREPFIKGRMTLFLFNRRYDYSEFGKMIERRQLPKSWHGHWFYNVVDAYGALIVPGDQNTDEGSYKLQGLLAQVIAGAYVADLNDSVPRWFAEGAARATAARVESADPRVLVWKQQLPRVLTSLNKPDDFLEGRLAPEDTDVASYSFVEFLMSDARRFPRLLGGLEQGGEFTEVFKMVYGITPPQAAQQWIPWAARQAARRMRLP